jgi:hypothetical protein
MNFNLHCTGIISVTEHSKINFIFLLNHNTQLFRSLLYKHNLIPLKPHLIILFAAGINRI